MKTPSVLHLLAVLALGPLGSLGAQTLVNNPGFENGTSSPTAWGNVIGTTGATATWVVGTAGDEVYQGTHAIAILNPAKNTYSARWVTLSANRYAVTAGTTYEVDLWSMGSNLDLTGGINAQDGFQIAVQWFDSIAGGNLISTYTGTAVSFAANDTWTNFSFDDIVAPVGAVGAGIQLVYRRPSSVTSGSDAMITWDNVNMYVVPEPGVVTLLALGFALILIRRSPSRSTL